VRWACGAAAIAVVLVVSGCSAAGTATPEPEASALAEIFPAGAVADYQLGGAYPPPDGVTVVARDSTEQPAEGLYNICYVNGFQTQPGVAWLDEMVLHDASGAPLMDPNWPDESIIDIRVAGAAERIDTMTDQCAAAGFDAVEFDNLDSYTRSAGQLTLDDAIAFATRLVEHAHSLGLAAGQKNTAQLGATGPDVIGFDFAIVEECDQFEECGDYTEVYGSAVIDIEYTDELRRPFDEVCADPATPESTILRDRDLTPAGSAGYEYAHC